jgi:hypothetical protein
MNERIADLYEKASEWALESDSPKSYKDRVMSKFAELIVQECIDIIAPYTVRMSRPGEEYLHPISEIKQHFGVEE